MIVLAAVQQQAALVAEVEQQLSPHGDVVGIVDVLAEHPVLDVAVALRPNRAP